MQNLSIFLIFFLINFVCLITKIEANGYLNSPCNKISQETNDFITMAQTVEDWICLYQIIQKKICATSDIVKITKDEWISSLKEVDLSILDFKLEHEINVKKIKFFIDYHPKLLVNISKRADEENISLTLRREIPEEHPGFNDNRIFEAVFNRNCTLNSFLFRKPLSNGNIEANYFFNSKGEVENVQLFNPVMLKLEEIYKDNPQNISLEHALTVSKNPNRIKVGLLDSGIDYNAPDLAYKISRPDPGYDYYEDDSQPYDFQAHGTSVAEIILQATEDIELIVATYPTQTNRELYYGIGAEYLVKRGARIINLSFGRYNINSFPELKKVIRNYPEVIFVAAAGNGGINNDEKDISPANWNFPNIISVASVDKNNQLGSSSNYGVKTVELAAFGEQIEILLPGGKKIIDFGTSFAAPQVTNAIARILAVNPNLKPNQVFDILKKSIKPIYGLKERLIWGGVLDTRKALELLK